MKRRSLIGIGAAGLLGLSGGVGWNLLNSPSDQAFKSLDDVQQFLKKLNATSSIKSIGEWTPLQIFRHMRQSIIFSMQGFPEMKSKAFQNTLGSLAFHIFSAKGAMTHSLSEPIPGAEALPETGDVFQEVALLIADIEKFLSLEKLYPHFAFGELTSEQSQMAQLFHINEHFGELVFSQ